MGLSISFSLYLFGAAGLVVTQSAGAIGSDEVILLITYATEVFPGIQLVVAEEVGVHMFSTPFVNKFGDKVNARFNGKDESWFERTRQS